MHRSHSFLKPRISKAVFLGQHSVGKTSLIQQIINQNFSQRTNSTIGIDLMTADLWYADRHFKLQMWDTAGQEKYQCLIPSYIKGSAISVFVFDLSNLQSMSKIEDWIKIFRQNNNKMNVLEIICGNKSDLARSGRVQEQLLKLIERSNLQYFQVSAKTGQGLDQMMRYIYRNLCDIYPVETNTLSKVRQQTGLQQSGCTQRRLNVKNREQEIPVRIKRCCNC